MTSTGCFRTKLFLTKRDAALLTTFLFVNATIAQVQFRNYGAESGFPYTNVAAIIQDTQGFIWTGSSEGLTKWDGTAHYVFTHSDTDSASLADNNIDCLFIDRNGKLWIGTRGGLSLYNPVSHNFLNFYHQPNNSNSLSSNDIWSIGQDSLGQMWVGTLDAGLNKLVITANGSYVFRQIIDDDNTINFGRNEAVWSLYFDDKGWGWAGTSAGLKIFKPGKADKAHFLIYKQDNDQPGSLAANFVWRIYEDKQKNVWLSSIDGMLDVVSAGVDKTNMSFLHAVPLIEKQAGITISSVNDFALDVNGNAWLSVNTGGIWYGQLSVAGNKLIAGKGHYITKEARDAASLADNMVWKIYCDHCGAVWCGTEKGVSVYDAYKEQFDVWGINRKGIFKEAAPIAYIDTDLNNEVWLASNNHLIVMSEKEVYKQISFDEPLVASCITKTGSLFVALLDKLLYYPPPAVSSFLQIKTASSTAFHKETILPSFTRINFLKLFGDELVAGGSGRLAIINANTLAIDSCTWLYNWLPARAQKTFRDVWLMDNMLWLGTDNGLYVFDRNNKKLIHTFTTATNPSILSNRINCLFVTHDTLYIGTPNGLSIYNVLQKQLTAISKYNGLADNQVVSIAAGNNGVIWLATRNGLSAYDPASSNIKNYTTNNGLLLNQLTTVAAANNYLFIGSDKGLNVLNTTAVFKRPPAPPVAFTDFLIHGKSILNTDSALTQTFYTSKKIRLNHLQNYFAISFAALDFANPQANQYAYKLEDFDTGWVYSTNIRSATYTNLKAGTYTFKVKAANSYNVWNEQGIALTIIITPPWWQTTVFYISCFLLAVAILYGIYKIRLNRILADQRMRNKIASDLHDDIGSSLSGIAIYSELAKTKFKEPELYRMLNAIAQNTKVTQQNMQDIVWSINPYNDTFDKIITRMKMFAADMLEPKGISIEFYADESLTALKLSPEKRKDLFLIYKEAVNNCAKYSEAANAVIKIEKSKNKIGLSVQDDGKGFDEAQVKKGNGLNTMQARAAALKGIHQLTTKPGSGTCVEIVFPYA